MFKNGPEPRVHGSSSGNASAPSDGPLSRVKANDVSADPFLNGNLATLAKRQPDLSQRLRDLGVPSHLEMVEARTGRPVLVKNGISLHSRHDPEAEARAFATSVDIQAINGSGLCPVIFGFGVGYHIRTLADVLPSMTVYEPDPAVLAAALASHDWTDLLPRITILTPGDDVSSGLTPGAPLIVHRPTERLEPLEYGRLKAILNGRTPNGEATMPSAGWKILVVTPICGGSLPVAHHAARALRAMGHQVIEADLSPLDGFYQQVRRRDVPEERRNGLAQRIIQFVGEHVTFLAEAEKPDVLLALAQAPLDRKTLDGVRRLGVPTAFWFVEDYRFLGYFREVAGGYDVFFHIQGAAMEAELARCGARHVHYLPLAADPDVFRPVTDPALLEPYRADVSFMGAGYPNRRALFAHLLDHELKIWGTEWELSSDVGQRVQAGGRRVSTEETVLIYNAARINLNLHSSVLTTGLDPDGEFINPRTYEIASCGAFQLVDRRHPLDDLFNLDHEMATFSSLEELRRKIDYYRARPELRKEIGARARTRVLSHHTYRHRMQILLDHIRTDLS